MSYIEERIKSIPKERIALTSLNTEYTYEKILSLISANTEAIENLRGHSLVINGRGRMEFALLLSLLDGKASSILFLPSDIDSSLHDQFYKEASVAYEVFFENDVLHYTPVSKNMHLHTNVMQQTQWIVPTSGTTSTPKLVSHTFNSLTRTAKQNITLGEQYRWGLVFDIYRFSGIQVFLQSLLGGSTLIITEANQTMSEILDILIQRKCNALSATPSFWRKVLMSQNANMLKLERITLGGEIADENTLQALRNKYPTAKISHIYASTEVGVGFSVTDGHEGFPASFLDGELPNIKMKIDDSGLLWISPPNHEQNYISDIPMYDEEGYINTGDKVILKNDRVYFLGRESGAINVGGNKVQPEEVELKLLASDIVAAAYVYPVKNAMMGSLVGADVVLSDKTIDKKEAKKVLLKHCRESMEGYKVPAILKFMDEVQTTQSGKLKRGAK